MIYELQIWCITLYFVFLRQIKKSTNIVSVRLYTSKDILPHYCSSARKERKVVTIYWGKLLALHCTNHDRRKRRHWQKKAKFRGSKVNRAHWKIHHWIIQFLLELLIALKSSGTVGLFHPVSFRFSNLIVLNSKKKQSLNMYHWRHNIQPDLNRKWHKPAKTCK